MSGYEDRPQITQTAWNFLNDAYETNVYVRFDSKEVVAAAFLMSVTLHGANGFASQLAELFDLNINNIESICNTVLDLYEQRTAVHTGGKSSDANDTESLNSNLKA